MKFGLLGRTLKHSFSPQIHAHLGKYDYALYEVEPEDLGNFLKNSDFTGINVTMPYKKAVIPYLDELSEQAQALGCVNTIVRRDGRLIGHNTDYFGFRIMTGLLPVNLKGKQVLVLGSGGASCTAVAVLRELGAAVTVISRSGSDNYNNLHLHRNAQVIVNTTPVGMYPNTNISPIDLDEFPNLLGVLDVVYNPARTKLVMDAQKRGIPAINGLMMLVAQAKEASEWFTETSISDEEILRIHKILCRQTENIILIGMPGSGKNTVGKLIAEALGKPFVDADEKIEETAGMSIPQIFANHGEEYFRELETRILSHLGKQSGLVIATGGGCVTKQRNYDLLHQNGTVFWIQRNVDLLARDCRPLSLGADLNRMYITRKPMYEAFCDRIVSNDTPAKDAAGQIIAFWRDEI